MLPARIFFSASMWPLRIFIEATNTTSMRRSLDSAGMIQTIAKWLDRYPILSVEDGLAEDDWENWPKLRERSLAGRSLWETISCARTPPAYDARSKLMPAMRCC